jgi:predicted HicB family RNase H-like nuclease
MPARKDKLTAPHQYMSVRLPVPVIEALSRMADQKKISRNRLVIQALIKLAKRHIEEAKS